MNKPDKTCPDLPAIGRKTAKVRGTLMPSIPLRREAKSEKNTLAPAGVIDALRERYFMELRRSLQMRGAVKSKKIEKLTD